MGKDKEILKDLEIYINSVDDDLNTIDNIEDKTAEDLAEMQTLKNVFDSLETIYKNHNID